MLQNFKNKKFVIVFLLILLTVVSISGGTSYAILKGATTSKNENVITTGEVSVLLSENFENIEKGVTTMSDVEAILHDEYYEFSVSNTGMSKVNYKLKLINQIPEGYEGKVLPDEYIRVGLEVNGNEVGPLGLSLSKNIIDTNSLKEKEIIHYKMRLWLDETKKKELKNMKDYKTFLKLKVEATQEA